MKRGRPAGKSQSGRPRPLLGGVQTTRLAVGRDTRPRLDGAMAENGRHHLQTTPTLYDQMTSACTSNLLIYAFCYGYMHQLLSDVEHNGVPIQEVRKQVFQLEAARQAVTEDLRQREEGVRHLAMDSARRRTGAK